MMATLRRRALATPDEAESTEGISPVYRGGSGFGGSGFGVWFGGSGARGWVQGSGLGSVFWVGFGVLGWFSLLGWVQRSKLVDGFGLVEGSCWWDSGEFGRLHGGKQDAK